MYILPAGCYFRVFCMVAQHHSGACDLEAWGTMWFWSWPIRRHGYRCLRVRMLLMHLIYLLSSCHHKQFWHDVAGAARGVPNNALPWLVDGDTGLALVTRNGQKEIMTLANAICQSVSQTGVSEIGIVDHDMEPKMKAGSMEQKVFFVTVILVWISCYCCHTCFQHFVLTGWYGIGLALWSEAENEGKCIHAAEAER